MDHATESLLNGATRMQSKLVFEGIQFLLAMVLTVFAANIGVQMWKREASNAFRRVPVAAEHLDLAWVIWSSMGIIWTAQHRGMPFGTVSAVVAWHHVGYALWWILVVHFKAPAARFVDDFFGVSKCGVYWTAGRLLSVVSRIVGLPTDDGKDADDMLTVVVLGIEAKINWPLRSISVRLEEAKAAKWPRELISILDIRSCEPSLAEKFAGRLNFAVVAGGNRVGRAFVGPMYAQALQPVGAHGCRVRFWLREHGGPST